MIVERFPEVGAARREVRALIRADEGAMVGRLAAAANLDAPAGARVRAEAAWLVREVRARPGGWTGVEALLAEYDLSSREGVVLMCLAEALLRIPDPVTADRLIRDTIGAGDWQAHLGHSGSLFVNASTWALVVGGRLAHWSADENAHVGVLQHLLQRSGEPLLRRAVTQAMRMLGERFVAGRTLDEAWERGRPERGQGFRHSYDMLGEAAMTAADAQRYFEGYADAIRALARSSAATGAVEDAPGISVKLSALHPRYVFAQRRRALPALADRLETLAAEARAAGIGLCVDAEESDRLDLSLDLIETVCLRPALRDWDGFGLAIQAYQKRCHALIGWLEDLAARRRLRLMVRLVKGAYWDTEIKHAQVQGLDDYPVFTRKHNTDVSYLACVHRLFDTGGRIYPQFATHNAHTAAWVLEAAQGRPFEFQRLHGMGENLHAVLRERHGCSCRIYAPVGPHRELLPYLVRRLLENGANSSFVHRIHDPDVPIEKLVADPVERALAASPVASPRAPPPPDLYLPDRRNSRGLDLNDPDVLGPVAGAMAEAAARSWQAAPQAGGVAVAGESRPVRDPADIRRTVGDVVWAGAADVARAAAVASSAAPGWDRAPAAERARCLEAMADLLEDHRPELMALCVRETGKTIPDSVAEVREAVDFCRYYAAQARMEFATPQALPGPTGESNEIALHGRGVFACISPWNFPLAIFCGQVAAALAAGNAVLAKPAEQASLTGARAVELFHAAGIPGDVLHLLPGDGATGAALVERPEVDGVAFTGSVEAAKSIQRALAGRPGPIVPLIAETGGINAMIADSTALPEQLVGDVLASAFQSAGQRCSALRVLYLQEELADPVLAMLAGAMDELVVGDPAWLETDIGPVIDAEARANLQAHVAALRAGGCRVVGEATLGPDTRHGHFVAPIAFEIGGIAELEREVFGPVLHVVRYCADELETVIEAINAAGYGLTFAVHTRIDGRARAIAERIRAGNRYVNRNQIGAVVGVQPFGGEALSGTGPKAGGPRYLHRFATERVLTVNTAAVGGNVRLLASAELDD